MSSMNSSGDKVFHSEHIRSCQFNGWFKEPKTKKLNALDMILKWKDLYLTKIMILYLTLIYLLLYIILMMNTFI